MCGMPAAVKAPSIRPAASSRVIPQSLNGFVDICFPSLTNSIESLSQSFLDCGLVSRTQLSNNIEPGDRKAAFKKFEPIKKLLNRIFLARPQYLVTIDCIRQLADRGPLSNLRWIHNGS